MATKSKLELAVDSGKWEDGLKKAQTSLNNFTKSQGGFGEAIDKSKDQMAKFIKMMGDMDSHASNSRGQIREYINVIDQLTVQFGQLSESQKNGEVGKAILQSIDELKKKAADAKDRMADLNEELSHMASDTAFTDGVKMMAGTVGSCASAFAAWSGNGKDVQEIIAKLAKIQTTVAAVESLTNAFQKQNLVLLKNPYVLIASAIAAATVALLDFLSAEDDVTKMQDDIIKKSSDEVAEFEALNAIIHSNTVSYDERNRALEDMKKLVPDYHATLTKEGQLINDNVDALDDYRRAVIKAAANEALKESIKEEVKEMLEKQKKLHEAQEAYEQLTEGMKKFSKVGQDLAREISDLKNGIDGHRTNIDNITEGWNEATNAVIGYADEAHNAINNLAPGVMLGAAGLADSAANSFGSAIGALNFEEIKKKLQQTRHTGGGGSRRTGGSRSGGGKSSGATGLSDFNEIAGITNFGVTESMNELKAMKSSLVKMLGDVRNEDAKNAIESLIKQIQSQIEAQPVALRIGWNTEDVANLQTSVEHMSESMLKSAEPLPVIAGPVGEIAKNSKDTQAAWAAASRAITSAGSAMQSMEDPAAKVAGIVMQAIANVALGFAQASASKATGAAGVWGWIAAATAGVATMVATISQIKSATKMADGGIVGGSSYVGDRIPTMLNAGEVVLNASQQQNLASSIQRNDEGGAGNSIISGEQLVTVINAYGRRTGRGEILR